MSLVQNNDIKVRYTITIDGVPAIINDLADYHVYVYHLNNGVPKLLATYKKDNVDEFTIEVEDSAAGKITTVIPRTLTRTLAKGNLFAEVKIQIESGAPYIDGVANVGKNNLLIGELTASPNPNLL